VDPDYLKVTEVLRNEVQTRFQETNPQVIADVFEDMLRLQKPELLSSFYSEAQALAAYDFARESLVAMTSPINRDVYVSALRSIARALEAALSAVFSSARPIQNGEAKFVEYRPILSAPYSAVFRTDDSIYDAIFDSELVLKRVEKRTELQHIWPPLRTGAAKSALIATLL
jgi:hypothetical protein